MWSYTGNTYMRSYYIQSITLIPDSVIIPEFEHIPDPDNFSPTPETARSMFCIQSGIRIYRISYTYAGL